MKIFTDESLVEVVEWIELKLSTKNQVTFRTLNPDINFNLFSGNTVTIDNQSYIYRGYKVWINLAELLYCRVLTPVQIDDNIIEITLKKLNIQNSFHNSNIDDKTEKYGINSKFFSINKNEEPTFLLAYKRALDAVRINSRTDILNLGINRADEFELISNINKNRLVGIDHSQSALDFAKNRFKAREYLFIKEDINKIDRLNLGKFDLIISIGTLQTPSINFKPFFMSLVQNYLTDDGAIILGFPNSRWIDCELIYGAKAPNYAYSEMSLVFNDVIFCKKYLQQKKFRVTITGREYIFLTATKIGY
ncbi:MAG: methyltransferase domain-containing protein [Epsilonproteobacteria bacterium]|nr:methyltransferase domain-containing protein [Campylobacterota bacterium]